MTTLHQLRTRIDQQSAAVGVIGLGYVGLALAVEFARAGFKTIGIDIDPTRVERINRGDSYIEDVSKTDLHDLVSCGQLQARGDFNELKGLDTVSICVPTPLSKTKDPDLSHIVSATKEIAQHLRQGQLIVLESTTYPGTTQEIILPELEATGLRAGTDFFLAFSPERTDPGNARYQTRNTPKIIGGTTPACLEVATALYGRIIERLVPVSSTRAAEMVKLLENTFRAVNIGLVNEVAIMCDHLRLDVWEIIQAAATKPYGFMPFYPGPGLGGHCIPVDVHYLAWKLRSLDYKARFIELASEINQGMPRYVVQKVSDALNELQLSIHGARILLLGVAYKRDTSDIRESPALDIIELLTARGAQVSYADPHVEQLPESYTAHRVELGPAMLHEADCVVITTDHSAYDFDWIAQNASLIIDTRNALSGLGPVKARVIKL